MLWLVVPLALVYGVTRNENMLLGLGLAVVGSEAVAIVREAPGVDDRWVGVLVGTVVTLVSLAWFGYELTAASGAGGPAWFPALTALVGVWFLLDARRDFVEGGPRDGEAETDLAASDAMLVMQHAHLVAEELKSGPKTVPELAAACDLTESRVREALAVAPDDAVSRLDESNGEAEYDGRYALDESALGPLAFVRLNGARALRRLARPFRRWP